MDYKDIIELILSENDYTVGGGCAAAISGAMACGLMGMVANLSKGKDFGQTDAQYDEIVAELNDLKARLLEGSVRDNEAYMMIVNAYKLPKTDETEIAERRAAIRRAGVEAASVPLANAKMNIASMPSARPWWEIKPGLRDRSPGRHRSGPGRTQLGLSQRRRQSAPDQG